MATRKRFHYEKPDYLRIPDAVKVFPFGEDKIKEIAQDIGALRKCGKCVFIKSIFEYDPKGKVASAYSALTEVVMKNSKED